MPVLGTQADDNRHAVFHLSLNKKYYQMKETMNHDLRIKVQAILFNDWDPVGINGNIYLIDEYDDYIENIIDILSNKIEISGIVNLLKNIEDVEIGSTTDAATRYNVAVKLMNLVNESLLSD